MAETSTPYLTLAIEQLKNGTFPIDSKEQIEQLVKDAEQAGILVELQEQSTGAKVLGLKIGDHYLPITDTKKNRFLLLSNDPQHQAAPLHFTTLSKDSLGSIATSDLTFLDFQRKKEAEGFGGFIRNEAKGVERLSGVQEGVGKALGEWGGFAAKLAKYAAITAGVVVLGVIATGSGGAVLAAIGSAVWGSIMGGTALGAVGGAIGTAFQATAAFVLGAGALGAGGAYINEWREQQGKSRLPTVFDLLNPSLALERSRAIKELDQAMQKGKTASGMQFTHVQPAQQELVEPVLENPCQSPPFVNDNEQTPETLTISASTASEQPAGVLEEHLEFKERTQVQGASYTLKKDDSLSFLINSGYEATTQQSTAHDWDATIYGNNVSQDIIDNNVTLSKGVFEQIVKENTAFYKQAIMYAAQEDGRSISDDEAEKLAVQAAIGEGLKKTLPVCLNGSEQTPLPVGSAGIAISARAQELLATHGLQFDKNSAIRSMKLHENLNESKEVHKLRYASTLSASVEYN
jgi:hypothetical protein